MARVWSEERKLELWLEVELAALDAWAELGVVPTDAVHRIRAEAAPPTPERVAEIERATNHDLAKTLSGAAAFIQRIVELHLREEPALDQELTKGNANGSLGRIGSCQGLLTHSLILRCLRSLTQNPLDNCRRNECET